MLALSPGLKPSSVPQVAIVRAPRLQAEPCVTLPLDINNYPMAKFIRCHFKVRATQAPHMGTDTQTLPQLLWGGPDPIGSLRAITVVRLS